MHGVGGEGGKKGNEHASGTAVCQGLAMVSLLHHHLQKR